MEQAFEKQVQALINRSVDQLLSSAKTKQFYDNVLIFRRKTFERMMGKMFIVECREARKRVCALIESIKRDIKRERALLREYKEAERELLSKKYVLMVSRDCGLSYFKEAESRDLQELLDKGKELDEQMLRWVIEDPITKEQVAGCKIFDEILGAIMERRKTEEKKA